MLLFNPHALFKDTMTYLGDSHFFLCFTLVHSKKEEKHEICTETWPIPLLQYLLLRILLILSPQKSFEENQIYKFI